MQCLSYALAGCLLASTACGSSDPAARTVAPEESATPVSRAGTASLTPAQLTNARIKLAAVERRAQAGVLTTTALIEPPGNGVARVAPRLAGRVVSLDADVGQQVKKGQTLAVIDAPELGRAKADYLAAMAVAKVARESADRERNLFEQKISSEKDYRQAETDAIRARTEAEAAEDKLHTLGLTERDLARLDPTTHHYGSTMAVTAPLDGVIVQRPAAAGMMVSTTDPMFVVMDLREVWVVMDVYEQDLAQVKVGQKVIARVDAFRDKTFPGEVASIGALVEQTTRAVKVRVVLANPTGDLKPGMFATVQIEGTRADGRDGMFIPSTAVQRDGDRAIVFVPRAERTFERHVVRIGREAGALVEVLEGLVDGQQVVTDGSFVLKSELKKADLQEDD